MLNIYPQLSFRQTPTEASAEYLRQIETRLQGDLHGQVRDFRMEMREGGLVLHGASRTFYAKQLAQEAVRQATQTPILLNNIEVA